MTDVLTRKRIRVPALPTAPRDARDFLSAACAGWDAEGLIEPGSLVVSELVSNAVTHAGGEVVVEVRLVGPGRLLVCVHDDGLGLPEVVPRSRRRLGGHGLEIVSRLSESWGVTLDGHGGKEVWCVLRQSALGAAAGAGGAG